MFRRQSRFGIILMAAGLISLLAAVEWQDAWAQGSAVSVQSEALAQRRLGDVFVTYESGQLTIKVQDAPLIEVLHAVCDRIGAVLDFPADAADRVTADLGPGSQRTVLAALLGNTRFDFATSGRLDDPASIARIALVVKGDNAVASALSATVQAAAAPGRPQAGASARGSGVDKGTLSALRDLLATESRSSVGASDDAGRVEGGANAAVAVVEGALKKAEDVLNSPGAKANNSGDQAGTPAQAAPEEAPSGRHRRRR